MEMNMGKLEIITSADRIRILATHRAELANQITDVEKPLQEAYDALETAFGNAILAEAKYLAAFGEQEHKVHFVSPESATHLAEDIAERRSDP